MLYKGSANHGEGVFTNGLIPKNTEVLVFKGELFHDDEIDEFSSDHYLQIDSSLYIGPSGMLDDYVNHSCDPNCGLLDFASGMAIYNNKTHQNSGISLISIKDIQPGEEITFDYSTSIDSEWTMECNCNSSNCRKTIGSFKNLSEDKRAFYINKHMVLSYLL